jgi:hypothetical protein
MKILTLVVCLGTFLTGCGSGGTNSANNIMMQAGQWEYVVVPTDGSIPMYIDMNLPGSNGPLAASNAVIFLPSEDGIPNQTGPIYCGDFNLNATISDSTLSGKFSWGQPASHFANFSGNLAVNGESISKGQYSGQTCLLAAGPEKSGPHVQGPLEGYMIAPVNGTYTGTLDSSLHGADVVTLTITQNPDFSLNVSGTSVENGVTTALMASTQPQSNSVTGATVYLGGSANNVNGSQPFTFNGHLNPNSTQLTVVIMTLGPNENVTGALTKQ